MDDAFTIHATDHHIAQSMLEALLSFQSSLLDGKRLSVCLEKCLTFDFIDTLSRLSCTSLVSELHLETNRAQKRKVEGVLEAMEYAVKQLPKLSQLTIKECRGVLASTMTTLFAAFELKRTLDLHVTCGHQSAEDEPFVEQSVAECVQVEEVQRQWMYFKRSAGARASKVNLSVSAYSSH